MQSEIDAAWAIDVHVDVCVCTAQAIDRRPPTSLSNVVDIESGRHRRLRLSDSRSSREGSRGSQVPAAVNRRRHSTGRIAVRFDTWPLCGYV